MHALSAAALVAAIALATAQDPAPAPQPPAAPAPAAPAASPEDAEWSAALEQKKSANALNDATRAIEAGKAFAAFAAAHPASPRLGEAFIEEGVCAMIAGRSLQKWHRNTAEGIAHFKRALQCFQRVPDQRPTDPLNARAAYCIALAAIQLDELERALAAFGNVIEKYASDREYLGKALERRAAVWRHRLDTDKARADLQRYVKEFGAAPEAKPSEELKAVQRFLAYTTMFGKPAPALNVEVWAHGEPQELSKLRGEVVALYFFAQWCHNCENEAGFLHEMNERWGPLGVHFIGVTDFSAAAQGDPKGPKPSDPAETQRAIDVVKAYVASHEFKFPVVMDRGANARTYQARKYPEIVLIDRAGNVVWHDHPATLLDSTLERVLFGAPEGASAPKPGGSAK